MMDDNGFAIVAGAGDSFLSGDPRHVDYVAISGGHVMDFVVVTRIVNNSGCLVFIKFGSNSKSEYFKGFKNF